MDQGVSKIRLENRGVLSVAGKDAKAFLQGLLTNDMEQVHKDKSIYACFLTPQCRLSCDLFVSQVGDYMYLLDVDRDLLPGFLKKLKLYRLKSKVKIQDVSAHYSVWVLWGGTVCADFHMECALGNSKPYEGGALYVDPRKIEMGLRALVPHESLKDPSVEKNPLEHHPEANMEDEVYSLYASQESLKKRTQFPDPPAWMVDHMEASPEDYDTLRLSQGIPECGKDMFSDKSIPLECNLDRLNAISFEKGCYLGQELIARTSHRGLVRKRLMPVRIVGEAPPPGTDLFQGEKKMGTLYSSSKNLGLALIRLEALEVGPDFSTNQEGSPVKITIQEEGQEG